MEPSMRLQNRVIKSTLNLAQLAENVVYSSTIWCLVYRAQRQCVRINHAYTSVLITPNVAAPSKTQEMTFLSLFLYTINHP